MSEKTIKMYQDLVADFESGKISLKEFTDRYNEIIEEESRESMAQNQDREFI